VGMSLGLDMLTEPEVRTDRVIQKSFSNQVQLLMHDRPGWVPGFQPPGHRPGCFSVISRRTSWHAVHLFLASTAYTLLHDSSRTQNTRAEHRSGDAARHAAIHERLSVSTRLTRRVRRDANGPLSAYKLTINEETSEMAPYRLK